MDVEIYTVDYCPYCKAALKFFNEHNVKYRQTRIDDDENAWFEKLGKTFNIKGDVTVPQIVIDGRHVGGYTDMMELYEKDELKFNDL